MARLTARHPWSHNDYFHGWVLANLPEPCVTALDVGCGRGGILAVLHHLDVADALHGVRRLLRPGGRFLAVGLAPPVTVRDHVWEVASVVTNPVVGYVTHPWPARPDHAAASRVPVRDPTLSFSQLQRTAERAMPGAVLRHRLGFRHTISWTKPWTKPLH